MWFGVAAGKQAVADSGFEITDANREDVGVVYGSGAGGHASDARRLDRRCRRRARGASRRRSSRTRSSTRRPGCSRSRPGRSATTSASCRPARPARTASPRRAEAIRRGDCIAVISGSTEAPLLEIGPRRLHEHARDGHAPAGRAARRRCRGPSTRPATGSSSARAPAALFLEDLELAKARGARIYAEVVGYGSAADGWDMIQPIDERHGLGPGDEDGPRAARRAGRRGRPDQPPRHLDAARRPARGRGDLDGLRRPRRRATGTRWRSAARSR